MQFFITLYNDYDFHNDYHFIIKESEHYLDRQFQCLGENTKKYWIFSVPLEKKVKSIYDDGNKIVVTMS